ncbi:MAG: hypothetical protein ACRDCW_16800 [Sarcina sp.]
MKHKLDIVIGFLLSFALFITFCSQILLTSDIPVNISNSEMFGICKIFIILTIIYTVYAIKSKQNLVNLKLLVIPLFLSIGNLSSIKYFPELAPMKITNIICAILPTSIFLFKYRRNLKKALSKTHTI